LRSNGQALLLALAGSATAETPEELLRRYLVERGLGPGDRLPSEAQLCEQLGASRVVVREALSSLQALGLIEARPGSGWFVHAFDVSVAARAVALSLAFHSSVLLDLLEVRRSLEADIAGALAGRLGEDDLAALEELVDRMRWRAGRGQLFAAEDGEFHRRLVAASGNLVTLTLVDLYWRLIEALYERGLPRVSPGDAPAVAAAHAQVVEALRCGDSERASRTLRDSHDESQRRFERWLTAASGATGATAPGEPQATRGASVYRAPGAPGTTSTRTDVIQAAIRAALLTPQGKHSTRRGGFPG
jgi:DNA-binding FadR family transcriptional regulator